MFRRLITSLKSLYDWWREGSGLPGEFIVRELPDDERADPLHLYSSEQCEEETQPYYPLDALPCPYCQKRFSARHFNTHVAYCDAQEKEMPF